VADAYVEPDAPDPGVHKDIIIKPDDRYLIFYTFDDAGEATSPDPR